MDKVTDPVIESLHPEKKPRPPLPRAVELLRAKRRKKERADNDALQLAESPKRKRHVIFRACKRLSMDKGARFGLIDGYGREQQDMLQALVKAVREAEGLSDPFVPGNSINTNSILRAYKPVLM
jgi:hypothetical protein